VPLQIAIKDNRRFKSAGKGKKKEKKREEFKRVERIISFNDRWVVGWWYVTTIIIFGIICHHFVELKVSLSFGS